ncbi:MAG: hypothetical protein S4CHLAM37_03790 [Chlamydiia bacterium]|nr:hypothetical protein [Chlamydiia bacterium]
MRFDLNDLMNSDAIVTATGLITKKIFPRGAGIVIVKKIDRKLINMHTHSYTLYN